MQLNNPNHQESIPGVGDDFSAASGNRFTPAPLSQTAMAFLQRSVARNQSRRRVFRAGHLRVCLDGAACWRCDPGGGVYEPFRVPLSASCLEIFGDDEDGTLLLAVFPLPAPEVLAADGAQHLLVMLEGGQTVAIEITLGDGTGGKMRAYVIQLSYTEATAAAPPGAANLSGGANPAVPRPETSTPGNPGMPASRRLEEP